VLPRDARIPEREIWSDIVLGTLEITRSVKILARRIVTTAKIKKHRSTTRKAADAESAP